MSRTYKDTPARAPRGRRRRVVPGGVPRRFVQRNFNRPERHAAKRALEQGDEPFPHQPRGRAHWDYW